MKNFKLFATVLCLTMLAVGCAHNHKVEGIQEKVELPQGIKISIGAKEVKDGETLDAFMPSCHLVVGGRGQKNKECHNNKVGEVKILKVIDDNSAIVEPVNNLTIYKEMTFEKQKGDKK